jgi:hypothetical protein
LGGIAKWALVMSFRARTVHIGAVVQSHVTFSVCVYGRVTDGIFIDEEGKHVQISVGLEPSGISIFKVQPKIVMDGYLKECCKVT